MHDETTERVGPDDPGADYLAVNRAWWDERAPLHAGLGSTYDLEAFRRDPHRLGTIELAEVGDVAGRTLLHLQCHIGTDTLSWATRGATVTGADFSPPALEVARSFLSSTNAAVGPTISVPAEVGMISMRKGTPESP